MIGASPVSGLGLHSLIWKSLSISYEYTTRKTSFETGEYTVNCIRHRNMASVANCEVRLKDVKGGIRSVGSEELIRPEDVSRVISLIRKYLRDTRACGVGGELCAVVSHVTSHVSYIDGCAVSVQQQLISRQIYPVHDRKPAIFSVQLARLRSVNVSCHSSTAHECTGSTAFGHDSWTDLSGCVQPVSFSTDLPRVVASESDKYREKNFK